MSKPFNTLISGLIGLVVLAAAPAALAETKIATIRLDYAILLSPQYKQGQDQMKTEFEKRKTDLEAEGKRLGDDAAKLKKEGDLMSADARSKAEKDFNTRRIDFEYKQRQFNEDATKRDRELTESMQKKILATIETIAKEKGISIVLRDPIYTEPAVDITEEVIKKLGGPVQPAAAPAKK